MNDKVPISWCYRVVKHNHVSRDWFDLQEVHYDGEGEVFGYVPTGVTANSREDLVGKLKLMLSAAKSNMSALICNEGTGKSPKVFNDNVEGFTDE